jgi:hypothetical protein
LKGDLDTYSNPDPVWDLTGKNVEVTLPGGSTEVAAKLHILACNV